MALKENTTHVVVEFCGEIQNKKQQVDMVVRSWVFYSQASARWICKYPQAKDYTLLPKWIQNSCPPEEDFSEYEIRIIKEASSYNIGLEYLKQSYETSEIKTINGEVEDDPNDAENPQIFSKKEAEHIFTIAGKASRKTTTSADDGTSNQKSDTVSQPAQHSVSLPKAQQIVPSPSSNSQRLPNQKNSETEAIGDHESPIGSESSSDSGTNTTVSESSSEGKEINMPSNNKNKGTVHKPNETTRAKSLASAGTSTGNKKIRSSTEETTPPRRRHKSPPVVASLQDLKNMEQRVHATIKSTKRSILYNISKIYRVVKASALTGNGQALDEPAPLENVLGMNFPLERIEDFETLEAKLQDPDAKAVMKTYMSLFHCGSTPQEDIANILPEIIKKSIQLLHSGSGRTQKGKAKRNFSATETYSCMEEILLTRHANKANRKQIRSLTGTWLSRAGDREGGKVERYVKAAADKAQRDAQAAQDATAAKPAKGAGPT